MDPNTRELREKYGAVADLNAAIALLEWDQETYMPVKGGPARGKQIATLSALAHRLFTDPKMGALLEALWDRAGSLEPDDRRLAEETRYDYVRATKLPERFVHALAEAQSRAFQTWVSARAQSDFASFLPHLELLVRLAQQKADLLGYEGSPYNALLQDYERGMTAEQLAVIFGALRPRLSRLVAAIVARSEPVDLSWLDQMRDDAAKWAFLAHLLRDMGYDFDAGRQDRSPHPFTTSFDVYDVRITTRPDLNGLFWLTSLHEGGHALYEQGHREEDRRTVLAQGPSLGIHESQSRLWENIIGRSLPFCRYCTRVLRGYFPELTSLAPELMYRAVNQVSPSLIRTEADECTYNLHVIMRFEIEAALIEGNMPARDVPEAWNAKMREYLGVDVPDDAHGCLQDVHWSHGAFGYFPTYTLGTLYSAQILGALRRALPDLWDQVERGDFSAILAWLRRHIHQVGRRKTAPEIMQDLAGEPIRPEPFMKYLEDKYAG